MHKVSKTFALCMALFSSACFAKSAVPNPLAGLNISKIAVIDKPIMQNNTAPIQTWLTAQSLQQPEGVKRVVVILNSPGGSVPEGIALINRMEEAKAAGLQIDCIVGEYAASMAFQIYLHCSNRYALTKAALLWHRVSVSLGGGQVNATKMILLTKEMLALDREALRDIEAVLPLSHETILRSFNQEQWHDAVDLHGEAPGFMHVATKYPGLYAAMDNAKVLHQSSPNIFSLLFGGDVPSLWFIAPDWDLTSGGFNGVRK